MVWLGGAVINVYEVGPGWWAWSHRNFASNPYAAPLLGARHRGQHGRGYPQLFQYDLLLASSPRSFGVCLDANKFGPPRPWSWRAGAC